MEYKLFEFSDQRGRLVAIEESRHIPFQIKRVFFIFDVPVGKTHGGHSHKDCKQFLIPIRGEFDVMLDDKSYFLCSPQEGLFVPTNTHVEMKNFSTDAIVLVLASEYYDAEDYIES